MTSPPRSDILHVNDPIQPAAAKKARLRDPIRRSAAIDYVRIGSVDTQVRAQGIRVLRIEFDRLAEALGGLREPPLAAEDHPQLVVRLIKSPGPSDWQ